MNARTEDDFVISLLAPLDRVEPVQRNESHRRRRGTRITALAVLVVIGAGIAGVAIADSWRPLSGIGAVDRPAKTTDTVSPAVAAQLKSDEQPPGTGVDPIGKRLVDQARLLGALPDGHRVYAVPSSKGKLCIVLASRSESCGDALTHDRPITLTIEQAGPGISPVVFGATTDDVLSVSFTIGGESVTAPAHHNFFAWEGSPSQAQQGVSSATVTFADGTTAIAH